MDLAGRLLKIWNSGSKILGGIGYESYQRDRPSIEAVCILHSVERVTPSSDKIGTKVESGT